MKFLITSILITIGYTLNAQICVSFDSYTLASDNGDGTCTYNVTLTVDSGNGAPGNVTFTSNNETVYTQSNCTCNPSTITFPFTVQCGSTQSIEVNYDAPGKGNDCTGSTGDFTLPVVWNSIEVSSKKEDNVLSWSTSTETNNELFIIEHANTSAHFEEIGYIPGAGTSDKLNFYVFTHKDPSPGVNYYRIKQMDYDGLYSYSSVVYTHNESNKISAYPNPFSDVININTDTNWVIMNTLGEILKKGKGNTIPTSDLKKGIYILNVIHPESKVQSKEIFIKQ